MQREMEARLREEIKLLDAALAVLQGQLRRHLKEKPPAAPWPLVGVLTDATRLWWELHDRWSKAFTEDGGS